MAEAAWRLFVAIPVPPAALESCRAMLDAVRTGPAGRGARWVRSDNLHLTIRFLGPTPPERVPALADVVRSAEGGRQSFDVALAGAGAFPDGRKPRALWIGITEGAEGLAAAARALDGPLAALGWPPEERPFRPHLTVARTDAASGSAASAAADALRAAAAGWRVAFRADTVCLYRSHLGGGPPRYEPLVEVALEG